mmetsp:Transcript_28658/g.52680  ORF Transcript_28658/g.52680 Transcript_28658/m.52680 type:complete len:371 (-) Transcript_28658:1403-2515(-)
MNCLSILLCDQSEDSSMFSFFSSKKRSRASAYQADLKEGLTNTGHSSEALLNLQSASLPRLSSLITGNVLVFKQAATYLPHPDKVHYGGEDAHFLTDYGGGAMGVADGVGGWQESGVNPAEYSRTLMRLSKAYLEGSDIFSEQAEARKEGVLIDPRGAINAAHLHTKVPGSSTACVIQLDQTNRALVAANLGDSGFVIIRDGKNLFKSKPLQHYFDCPLQFGAFPEYVEATDTADMADVYSIPLRRGDVIVAGSDGLWDNTPIPEIISMAPRRPEDVEMCSQRIANAARTHAGDPTFPSPYTREALSQGLDLSFWDKISGIGFRNGKLQMRQLTGGKMDDITVLVAFVDEIHVPSPVTAASPAPAPDATL